MTLFSADATTFSKKKNAPENIIIMGSIIIRPSFFSVLARLPKRPQNRNPLPPKAP